MTADRTPSATCPDLVEDLTRLEGVVEHQLVSELSSLLANSWNVMTTEPVLAAADLVPEPGEPGKPGEEPDESEGRREGCAEDCEACEAANASPSGPQGAITRQLSALAVVGDLEDAVALAEQMGERLRSARAVLVERPDGTTWP